MQQRRLLMIGILAVVTAGALTFLAYKTLVGKARAMASPSRVVVVATKDLAVGAMIAEGDVNLVSVPIAAIPADAIADIRDAVGRGVIAAMKANEVLVSSRIAEPNAGAGLPAMIPREMRAVSVQVNDVISVAGFVAPGTRVDVLLTGNPHGRFSNAEMITTTVLQNVEVLAAGQKIKANEDGKPEKVPVITLLVSPTDAQKLTLANSQGKIQLALRNPLDADRADTRPVWNSTLYGAPDPEIKPPVSRMRQKKVAPPPPPPVYTVEVLRGDKRTTTTF